MAKSSRDNFSQKVITTLAGRVAYRCSNPFCRRITIGPNTVRDKTTLIGVAAHITAAAPRGPRYNPDLTNLQRSDINNGIWLCCNCSTIIDKDEQAFPVSLLVKWRIEAEAYADIQLRNSSSITISSRRPKIEAVLLWQRSISSNAGLAEYVEPGGIIYPDKTKFFYKATRYYKLQLLNNTSIPAVNLSIQQLGNENLLFKDILSPVNNLNAFQEISFECELSSIYIMTGNERMSGIKDEGAYPDELSNVELCISYLDEHEQAFQTLTSFSGKKPNNIFR